MAAVLKPRVDLRPMTRADLDAVIEIEHRAYPFPWTRAIFADCIRVGYCCRVATVDGIVAGYFIVSIAASEAHLLNLCVDPERRRCGLGGVLLEGVLLESRIQRAERLFLEVRPSNRAAITLYQRSGFRIISRRADYYPAVGGREDAVVMVRQLDGRDCGQGKGADDV